MKLNCFEIKKQAIRVILWEMWTMIGGIKDLVKYLIKVKTKP